MDLSNNPEEVVLECVTASSEDPPASTTTDLSLPAPDNETVASEMPTADEPPSAAVVDAVLPGDKGTVKSDSAEEIDEPTVPSPSSPASNSQQSQLGTLSPMKATLLELETLRAEVLRGLETAMDGEDSVTAEDVLIGRRLLQSLELGIGEMQACVLVLIVCNFNRFNLIFVFSQFSATVEVYGGDVLLVVAVVVMRRQRT